MAARQLVYPSIFNVTPDRLSFETTRKTDSERSRILDAEMAVDRTIYVSTPAFHGPLKFTAQERFRDSRKYSMHQDLTITEWYQQSNRGAELYRINAGLFVYGYFDTASHRFSDVIAVNTVTMLRSLIEGRLEYTSRRNDRYQTFIAIPFAKLEACGCVIWRMLREKAA